MSRRRSSPPPESCGNRFAVELDYVLGRSDGVLELAGDRVDHAGELGHGVQRAVLAPTGDIRDRLTADIEPAPAHTMNVTVSTSTSA